MLYSNPLLTSFPYLSTISFCSDGVFLEIEAISDAVMPPRFNADVAGIASRYANRVNILHDFIIII